MENIAKTKTCHKCKNEQSIEEFHNNKREKDGLDPKCKKCKSTRKPRPINLSNTKVCITCNNEKLLNEFPRRLKGSLDGYRNECYSCKNARHVKYRADNYEELYNYHLEYGRKHRPENREKYRAYVKKYREKHPERKREQERRYRQNPNYRIKKKLRTRIKDALRNYNTTKNGRATTDIIGCKIDFFINYIESLFYDKILPNGQTTQMTKDILIYSQEIELDHIIPLWKFDLTDLEEQKKAFHYTNIQPLWKEDHNIKTLQDYKEYCNWQSSNIPLKEYIRMKNSEPQNDSL